MKMDRVGGLLPIRKQAMEKLKEAASMAGEHIPKQGWVKSITTWGMGYFNTSSSPKAHDVTEEELAWYVHIKRNL
jgi:hypothetical protein